MIVVELAGAEGVGKSTLSPLIAERLRELLGSDQVAALPERHLGRRQRRWTRLNRVLWHVSHPWLWFAARRLSAQEIHTADFSKWLRIFSTLGIARKAVGNGVRVAMVDQGVLRLPMRPTHVELFPRNILPDMVLHLVADPAVLEWRRLTRDKTKFRRHQGDQRLIRARKTFSRMNVSEKERHAFIVQFGERLCDPAFSETEVAEMLAFLKDSHSARQAEEMEAENTRPLPRCAPGACKALKGLGVKWSVIDTTNCTLEQVVENCCQVILSVLTSDVASDARGPYSSQGN